MLTNMESSTFWEKIFTHVQALAAVHRLKHCSMKGFKFGLAFQSNRGIHAR